VNLALVSAGSYPVIVQGYDASSPAGNEKNLTLNLLVSGCGNTLTLDSLFNEKEEDSE